MLRRLSPLLFPIFGLALLLLRHHPFVASHWLAWLQAPRVAGFGVALWWGLRERGRQKNKSPEESGGRTESRGSWGAAWWLPAPGRPLRPRSPFRVEGQNYEATGPKNWGGAYHLPPSHAIACAMLLADGLAAAGGLWARWDDVRALSVAAWLVAAAIGWRAR